MTLLARVIEERHGDVLVAAVEGEVDASNTEEIADRLRSGVSNRTMSLIVDLSETSYLDSAGINLLFALAGALRERQQRLLLVVPPGAHIARAISITGLDTTVPTHPDREAALAAAS